MPWPHHGLAVHDVVGDVEQSADEGLVAGDAFLLDVFARTAGGQTLGIEAALGAHRHDDGVLDVLRLHEAQHLGAEIFAAIRPADAATRHVAHAQVHAFDARAVDEDLELRSRQRQVRYGLRVELERHPALAAPPSVRPCLIVVSAQRGADHGQVGAQDAVLVEAGHLVERAQDRPGGCARAARSRARDRRARTASRTAAPAAA